MKNSEMLLTFIVSDNDHLLISDNQTGEQYNEYRKEIMLADQIANNLVFKADTIGYEVLLNEVVDQLNTIDLSQLSQKDVESIVSNALFGKASLI